MIFEKIFEVKDEFEVFLLNIDYMKFLKYDLFTYHLYAKN